MSITVTCPRCGQPAEYNDENPYRPFCSKRCKDSDLYAWLVEPEKTGQAEEADDPEGDPPALH